MRDNIEQIIQHALEASFYIRPREPGLTADEIRQVAVRAGFCHTGRTAHPRSCGRLKLARRG